MTLFGGVATVWGPVVGAAILIPLSEVLHAELGDPEINAVFAQNDDMGIGAIQAIEAAGKKPGTDIKIVTVDGIHDGFVAMAAGKINGIIECNPLLGPQLMETIKQVLGAVNYLHKNNVVHRGMPPFPALDTFGANMLTPDNRSQARKPTLPYQSARL